MRLHADNVHNLGGRTTGNDVGIKARTDLTNIGGTIDAASRVKLDAGRDIRIESTTRTATSSTGALPGKGSKSGVDPGAVTLDRVAGVYVTNPGGTLSATAGRDIQLVGAQIESAGDILLDASLRPEHRQRDHRTPEGHPLEQQDEPQHDGERRDRHHDLGRGQRDPEGRP